MKHAVRLAVLLVAVLMAVPARAAAAAPARAADEDAAARPHPWWQWQATYTLDALHAARPRLDAVLGHLDLRLDVDAERLAGWAGTTASMTLLVDHGGKPNRTVGTLQGLSSIEVVDAAARLYAAWVQRRLAPHASVLVGLYDLNSEFYVTEAAGLLIHPAFGIGSEFAQTGANGPSVFPNLSLGVRLRAGSGAGHYAQAALLDAVPGDPADPGRTAVHLSRSEGALMVAEAGWQQPDVAGGTAGRWGVGIWGYNRPVDRLDGRGAARNHGAYLLAQALLADAIDRGTTTAFVRAGVAQRRVNAIDAALNAGVVVDRPWGAAGPAQLTVGVAAARLGRAYRAAQAASGPALRAHETTLEIGARWQPWPALEVQPLVQRIWHPAGRADKSTTLLGVRLVWTIGSETR